ncbi:MAG: leucine-rich repeat protein [[Clostridium] fimetarium]|nr:leucine-rich repeat protein [[Clostridium] fimetarium]
MNILTKMRQMAVPYRFILLSIMLLASQSVFADIISLGYYIDGLGYDIDRTHKEAIVTGSQGFNFVNIPDSVTYEGEKYPVTIIDEFAFGYHAELTSIKIGKSVRSIRKEAFYKCTGLKSLIMGDSVTTIGPSAFTGCSSLTSVTIPASMTTIGDRAFSGSGLTSLSIPPSVSTIGDSAFRGCELTSLTIPNTVTSIGDWAFGGNAISNLIIEDGKQKLSLGRTSVSTTFSGSPLTTLYLGRNLAYYSYHTKGRISPFYDMRTLTDLTIGNSVSYIPSVAFANCTGLTSVKIPSSVKGIGDLAFTGCTSLTSVDIGDSVTSIGESAFEGCYNLTSFTIPPYVNRIPYKAFKGCSALRELRFEDGENTLFLEGEGHSDGFSYSAFYSCPITSLYLGRTLSYEKGYEPKPYSSLTNLTIGRFVTELSDSQFSKCDNLEYVKISSLADLNFKSAGFNRYQKVRLLPDNNNEFSDINESVLNYFTDVLAEKDGLEYAVVETPEFLKFTNSINVSDKFRLVRYGDRECVSCEFSNIIARHNGIDVSNSLTPGNEYGFVPSEKHKENVFNAYTPADKASFREVALKKAGTLFDEIGLQNIEKIVWLRISGDINGTDVMTINKMTSLRVLDLTNANIVAGGTTYRDNLKTQTDVVGSYFFKDVALEYLWLPESAKTIARKAFEDLTSLISISIPNSATTIGDYAFNGCSSLTSVTLPDSVTSIGESAFSGCSGLTFMAIPDSVTTISNSTFSSCSGLTNVTIPNSVTFIGKNAFYGCKSLKSLTIPNSVTEIGNDAFEECSSLNELILEDGKNTLNCNNIPKMFADSPIYTLHLGRNISNGGNEPQGSRYTNALRNLTIGDSVSTINSYTFWLCYGLQSVTIPQSVTSIGESAFSNTGLESVELPENLSYLGNGAFAYCGSLRSVTIPQSVTSIGESAFSNSGLESVELPENLSYLGNGAFAYCRYLKSVTIPQSVTSIGESAFSNSGLESVELPENLSYLGNNAFRFCKSLRSVHIPSSLTKISAEAFRGTALTEIVLPAGIGEIGAKAFAETDKLTIVVSLNPVPPYIDSTTFDAATERYGKLYVPKESIDYYRHDPVWNEWRLNITSEDDLIRLEQIPSATYGDGEIDLSQYAPADVALTYTVSHKTSFYPVVEISGSKMRIVGVGEVTIDAELADGETSTRIYRPQRKFKVNEAELEITAQSYEVLQNDPLPDFGIAVKGFRYDEDISILRIRPRVRCEVSDTSVPGEYMLIPEGGYARNYTLILRPGKLVVKDPTGIHNVTINDNSEIICSARNGVIYVDGATAGTIARVYTIDGNLIHAETADGESMTISVAHNAFYIVQVGTRVFKVHC